MQRLVKALFLIPILSVTAMIFIKSLEYYTPDFSRGYLSDKEAVFQGIFAIGFYMHIASAALMLLVASGLVCFRLEVKWPRIHRFLGKTYVLVVLLLSAPGGMVLAFYAIGGWPSILGFCLLALGWWGFTWFGIQAARQRQFRLHKLYMQRSYVLALSAVSLRIMLFICQHYLDWQGEDMYRWVAWVCWLPFWLGYELLVGKWKWNETAQRVEKQVIP